MSSNRKKAIVTGILFIIAAVTSIIGLVLYQPILNDPDFIIKGSLNETQVIWGAFCELVLAFTIIGISVIMFPIVKKESESIAIGYVTFRLLEATIIIIGIISLLAIVTLSQEYAKEINSNAISFIIAGRLLVALHNWTFLLGPNLVLGPSTLLLSYFLYTSNLVPRFISVLGLVGGALIIICAVLVMFGAFLQISVWGAILALPVFAYEMTLAVWLITKGFHLFSIIYVSNKAEF